MDASIEPAEAASAFTSDQYADAYPPGIEHGYWTLTRNRLLSDLLIEADKGGLWDRTDTLLEIGCGTGIVVNALRERGYEAWGVELAEPPALPAAVPYLMLGRDALDLDPAFRGKVTAILLLDVIEHIAEPVGFLAALVGAYPRCRIFVLTVPARQEVWSNYDTYYGHYRRYDRALLTRTLREAGLDPTISRYFFFPLYVAARLLALARRRRAVLVQSPRHLGLQRALASAFYAVERIVRPFPALPGLSLMAVAVRPPR